MVTKPLPGEFVRQFMQQKFIGFVVAFYGHQTFTRSICKTIHAAKIHRLCTLRLTKCLPGQSVSQFMRKNL